MNPQPTGIAPLFEGCYAPARQVASPNFNARPAQARVNLIVVHSISLPPGEFGGPYIEQLFTNRLNWDAHPYFQSIRGLEVSAHFVIARDGAVTQFVNCNDRAWHAGQSSYRGQNGCNDHSIGIELEGLEGGLFTEAQYQQLAHLCEAISATYPIEAIAGHEHIAPGRKADPGAGFAWHTLQHLLPSLPVQWPREAAQPHVAAATAPKPLA